ncbi:hypothetical protein MHSWG343_06540 [Candidatus Mycoplasma haematohominis]|uniref:Uncharacterized protein n=1 Tax=Candidatus Mycoplasma haematohominis TaxID=1494318 RepID=A0A478FRI2_9MOLU|nr:hypothetical protein MHSWG343_06540 [Candidatus Mycoplasma haemohominis]
MSVAKAAGVAAVVVGVAGTGYGVSEYLKRPYLLSYFLSTSDGQSKKGEYEHQLGKVGGNSDVFVADMKENENWWKNRFEELKEKHKARSAFFTDATTYSLDTSSSSKAINKLCDAAYKKHVSEFSEDESSTEKKKYKKDVELFCTLSGKEGSIVLGIEGVPTTLKGQSGYSSDSDKSKYGYKHADKLISTAADRNKVFWEERVKKLVSNSTSIETEGFFKDGFKTEFEGYKSSTNDSSKLNTAVEKLKEGCKQQYGKTSDPTATDKAKWEEFWRFCSVDGSVPSNLIPA